MLGFFSPLGKNVRLSYLRIHVYKVPTDKEDLLERLLLLGKLTNRELIFVSFLFAGDFTLGLFQTKSLCKRGECRQTAKEG